MLPRRSGERRAKEARYYERFMEIILSFSSCGGWNIRRTRVRVSIVVVFFGPVASNGCM